ncbi:hypothetical protein [Alloprevotella tannerae]|nr:hypothetical protein [Alloprevotella tannerae]
MTEPLPTRTSPKEETLEFLRQFARRFRPEPIETSTKSDLSLN